MGAVGAGVAGSEQASGQEQAAKTQAGELGSIQKLENPFVQAGYGATNTLSQMLSPGGYLTQQFSPTQQQLEDYPGYQFQQQQGQLATESANTPGVGALSGPALKSLMSFNQGLAASNYGNYFNQFQTQQNNIFSRLSGLAQLGEAGAAGVASAGTQLGQGIAQAQAGAAGSIAGGIVGATNSAGNAFGYYAANSGSGGNPYNLGGSTSVAPAGSNLTYDQWGNITGSVPIASGS